MRFFVTIFSRFKSGSKVFSCETTSTIIRIFCSDAVQKQFCLAQLRNSSVNGRFFLEIGYVISEKGVFLHQNALLIQSFFFAEKIGYNIFHESITVKISGADLIGHQLRSLGLQNESNWTGVNHKMLLHKLTPHCHSIIGRVLYVNYSILMK